MAVISYALWQNWFGGDSSIVGQSYEMSGSTRTVVGVMGPEFRFPNDGVTLWMSSVVRPEGITPGRFGSPLVARLAPGATPETAARELTALSKELPERFGGTPNYARLIEQHRAVVRPLETQLLGPAAGAIWILFGAVGVVLLIACANVANLFLVRSEGRQRDLAVRRAIGAARSQLIRLQLSEAFVVALLGGVIAVALTFVTLPLLVHAAPPGVPRLDEVHVTGWTLVVHGGGGPPRLAGMRAVSGGARFRPRSHPPARGRAWLHAQPALGARWAGRGADGDGARPADRVGTPGAQLPEAAQRRSRLLDAAISSPSRSPPNARRSTTPSRSRASTWTSWSACAPSRAWRRSGWWRTSRSTKGRRASRSVGDGASGDAEEGKQLRVTFAAGDYFKAMDIAVRAGQAFPARDLAATKGKVVISQKAADLLWPGQDAIGRQLKQRGDSVWFTVIGVVEDVLQNDLRQAPDPLVYFPLVGPTPRSWMISSPAFVLKTARAETIASEVRALVHEVAPEAPMYRVYTMAGLAADSMVGLTFTMLTLAVVSALALLLGTLGLYGVLSYVVAERTREIGVRMALGARAEQVRRMVVGEGARVVGVGAVIGVVVALGTTRLLESMLFGVAPVDWITFVGMSAAMLSVGMLASYIPARRASQVAPMESLRGE